MKHLSKLIAIGSVELGHSPCDLCGFPSELELIFAAKNGFYAFESSLLVRHIGEPSKPMSCLKWNEHEAWKFLFENPPIGFCFAENIFGEQFFLHENAVWHFDPETSETTRLSNSLEEWAEMILDDYNFRTGYSLAREWQTIFGALPLGTKLIPKRPFVLGGEFEVANLRAVEEGEAMRIRAAIANQIWNLPDGTSIEISLVE